MNILIYNSLLHIQIKLCLEGKYFKTFHEGFILVKINKSKIEISY